MNKTGILVIVALAAVAAIVMARFELLCLRELARTPDVGLRYLSRPAWTATILLAVPLGGIAFLYLEGTANHPS